MGYFIGNLPFLSDSIHLYSVMIAETVKKKSNFPKTKKMPQHAEKRRQLKPEYAKKQKGIIILVQMSFQTSYNLLL